MKKKVLALLLVCAMALALVACGGNNNAQQPSNSGGSDAQQPAADGGGNGEGEAKSVKVGLICIGDENDQGYTYNFIRGKEAATEALAANGINVESGRTPAARTPTSSWRRRAVTSSSTTPSASSPSC